VYLVSAVFGLCVPLARPQWPFSSSWAPNSDLMVPHQVVLEMDFLMMTFSKNHFQWTDWNVSLVSGVVTSDVSRLHIDTTSRGKFVIKSITDNF